MAAETVPTEPSALIASLLARCVFPARGSAATCAVSGGPDSLALMALAVEAGLRVTAVHVDHSLRPGSAGEGAVVEGVAARLGAGFRSVRADVTDGPNLEARARAARYAVLPDDVLTGHTADDQAETVVLNLMRGAGVDGLCGMVDDGRRPLLRLRRHETEALCDALGFEPVRDPTNGDRRFRRNRVRHEVLPLMNDVAQRDVAAVVARQSRLVADDAALLDELAAGLDPTDARALATAPAPLARRAVRRWLRSDHPPDGATVDRVLAVARNEAAAADVGAGRRVERSRMTLRLVESRGRARSASARSVVRPPAAE